MNTFLKSLILFFALMPACAKAQNPVDSAPAANNLHYALKTNLISDVALTPNIIGEVGFKPRWSAQAGISFNPWTIGGDKYWRQLSIMPEVRYWFCDHFAGHFLGAHLFGGLYNVGGLKNLDFKFLGTDFSKLSDHRYQGWYVGAGVAYGYAWALSRHWNLEAELGFGYAYTRYDKFRCVGCGKKEEEDKPHHYVGPTKAALNLVYVF